MRRAGWSVVLVFASLGRALASQPAEDVRAAPPSIRLEHKLEQTDRVHHLVPLGFTNLPDGASLRVTVDYRDGSQELRLASAWAVTEGGRFTTRAVPLSYEDLVYGTFVVRAEFDPLKQRRWLRGRFRGLYEKISVEDEIAVNPSQASQQKQKMRETLLDDVRETGLLWQEMSAFLQEASRERDAATRLRAWQAKTEAWREHLRLLRARNVRRVDYEIVRELPAGKKLIGRCLDLVENRLEQGAQALRSGPGSSAPEPAEWGELQEKLEVLLPALAHAPGREAETDLLRALGRTLEELATNALEAGSQQGQQRPGTWEEWRRGWFASFAGKLFHLGRQAGPSRYAEVAELGRTATGFIAECDRFVEGPRAPVGRARIDTLLEELRERLEKMEKP